MKKLSGIADRLKKDGKSNSDAVAQIDKVSHVVQEKATDVSAISEEQSVSIEAIAAANHTFADLAQKLQRTCQNSAYEAAYRAYRVKASSLSMDGRSMGRELVFFCRRLARERKVSDAVRPQEGPSGCFFYGNRVR